MGMAATSTSWSSPILGKQNLFLFPGVRLSVKAQRYTAGNLRPHTEKTKIPKDYSLRGRVIQKQSSHWKVPSHLGSENVWILDSGDPRLGSPKCLEDAHSHTF